MAGRKFAPAALSSQRMVLWSGILEPSMRYKAPGSQPRSGEAGALGRRGCTAPLAGCAVQRNSLLGAIGRASSYLERKSCAEGLCARASWNGAPGPHTLPL